MTVGRIKGLHARFSYDSLREKESEGWLVNCKSSGAGSSLNVHAGVRNCKSVLVSEMSWQREIERVDQVGGWVIRAGFVGRAEATTSKSDFRSTCIDFAGCSAYTFAGVTLSAFTSCLPSKRYWLSILAYFVFRILKILYNSTTICVYELSGILGEIFEIFIFFNLI